MNLTGKHLLICEEALTDYSGHFFTWIKAIRTIHLAAGARVTVAANRNVTPEIQKEIGAIPTYSHNIWDDSYYHPNPVIRYAGVFLHNWRVYTQTAHLLKQIGPVDLILLPACRIHHLIAWRLLCARYLGKKFQRLLFFILTSEAIYNPDFTAFHFKKSSLLLKATLRTFAGLTRHGGVVPAGDSHITCHEYETFSGLPFRVLPSPGAALIYAKLSAGAGSSGPRTHDAGPRFVMLGLSGYDKGTDLVQDAVMGYLEKNPVSPARFVIQWSKPVVTPDGTTIPIRDALRNAPQIQLIEGSLSDVEYRAEFAQADFLLLPYRRRIYFNRISGVAVEAACSGIPMIVTENTWLSWALEEFGAGVTVKNDSAADLVRKITHCFENWKALAQQAKDRKAVALEKNSTDRYLMCAWE
ncbi:MAG: glycosyltransferase [Verrucomicrobiae bacterium]